MSATHHGDTDRYDFRAVDASSWEAFEALFEAPGAPKYCWCMVFRTPPDGVVTRDNASRKAEIQRRIAANQPVGILAFAREEDAGEPVGWCSIAPVATFQRLGKAVETSCHGVWSLTCFFVPRRLRGEGLARRLLQAAIAHARDRGAHTLEAYPVDPDSPSYRLLGFLPMFRAAGFEEVEPLGKRRHVMRLTLRSPRPSEVVASTDGGNGQYCTSPTIISETCSPNFVRHSTATARPTACIPRRSRQCGKAEGSCPAGA